MKHNHLMQLAALLTAGTMLLTGCGGNGGNTTTAGAGTAEGKTEAAQSETGGEPVEITFTYWGSGAEKTAIEASVKTFEEANPDIKVKAMHIPSDDFLTKLNAMIAAGETPDISYSASWKCQFGEDGLIYNFYDLKIGRAHV